MNDLVFTSGLQKKEFELIDCICGYTNSLFGKYKAAKSFDQLYEVVLSNNETYEYIPGDKPVRGYLDIDISAKNSENVSLEYFNSVILSVRKKITEFFSNFEVEFTLLTAHCPKNLKFSGHLILDLKKENKFYYFKNQMELKSIVEKLNFPFKSGVVDLNVYKERGCLFRTIYSDKKNEGRKFILNENLFNEPRNPRNCFVTELKPDFSIYTFEKIPKIKFDKNVHDILEKVFYNVVSKDNVIFLHDYIKRDGYLISFRPIVCINKKMHHSNNSFLTINRNNVVQKCLDADCKSASLTVKLIHLISEHEINILFSGGNQNEDLIIKEGINFLSNYDVKPEFSRKTSETFIFNSTQLKDTYSKFLKIKEEKENYYLISEHFCAFNTNDSPFKYVLPGFDESNFKKSLKTYFGTKGSKTDVDSAIEKINKSGKYNKKIERTLRKFVKQPGQKNFTVFLLKLINKKIVAHDKTNIFLYNKKKRIWEIVVSIDHISLFLEKKLKKFINFVENNSICNKIDSVFQNIAVFKACCEDFEFKILVNKKLFRSFDAQGNFICFINGVYDLSSNTIMPIKKNMYISKQLTYKYSVEYNNECVDFLRKPFKNETEFLYFLCIIRKMLNHEIDFDFIFFLIGSGSNGKTKIIKMIESALESYGIQLHSNFFSTEINTMEKPSPFLIELQKSKIAFLSEPNLKKLDNSIVKRYVSCETFRFRGLYEKKEKSLQIKTKYLVASNFLPSPKIANDFALWRRIKVILFRKKFTADPAGNEEKAISDLDSKINKDDWKSTFMHLVLNASEVVEPDEFISYKQKSIKKENSLIDFLEKNVVQCEESWFVTFPEIYADFNGFSNENVISLDDNYKAAFKIAKCWFEEKFGVQMKQKRISPKRVMCWVGFKLVCE